MQAISSLNQWRNVYTPTTLALQKADMILGGLKPDVMVLQSCVRFNDEKAPRQSNSRISVAYYRSTNREQNKLLWAPKKRGAHGQLPTPPNE
ncbi:hypothetical protein TNCV_3186031 [Trichonephila clavipes]|nr:hypothetical protein TNCV_3186031 [Trichonephila clavipes]